MESEIPTLLKIANSPQTLRDIVQEQLREAIITGLFEPGQRLVERSLCDQLGVSRTVVRETIRYLEAEGLVDLLPNKGPIVALMDWNQARQIYQIRMQLESSAAVTCAENNSEQLGNKILGALNDLEIAFEQGAANRLIQATSHFYQTIFQQAGHDIAWEIVQRLNGRISRLRVLTLSSQDRHKSGFSHMQEISNSILQGDPESARRAVETHIKDASEVARRLLEDVSNAENNI